MSVSDEMACQELVEVITAYLEGTLSAGDRTRFETHLIECPGCRTYLHQMRATVHVLGETQAAAMPAGEQQRLLDLFRDWNKGL
jgi:anti-sigma factor RsiW